MSLQDTKKPYVIAEMSGNHQSTYPHAEKLLIQCAVNGASAFKIQTYTPESMTLNCNLPEYIVGKGPWEGRNLFDLYSQAQTPAGWIPDLFQVAKEHRISIFSTPFSLADVDVLENQGVCAYKIASFEITYVQLLKYIAQTKKPVIFSTGLATLDEIKQAVEVLGEAGSSDISILKCTTSYPANMRNLNLKTIPYLMETYKVPVGFSDHTVGSTAAIAAVTLGATILEKHIKLDEDNESVDSSFSLPVSALRDYITAAQEASLAMGGIQDGPTDDEHSYLKYRRSIVAKTPIRKGERIDMKNVAIVRPDIGLGPSSLDLVIGSIANRNIQFGEGIRTEDLQIS